MPSNTDRSRLIRLASALPAGDPHRRALLTRLVAETKTANLGGPWAWVDKRKVTIWTSYPLKHRTDSASKVAAAIKQASGILQKAVRSALSNGTPSALSIGNSVSMGHLVGALGSELIIYAEFWKEGSDRTRDELAEMREHFKSVGLALAQPGPL